MAWAGNYEEAKCAIFAALDGYGNLLRLACDSGVISAQERDVHAMELGGAMNAVAYIANCNALAWGRIQELRATLNRLFNEGVR